MQSASETQRLHDLHTLRFIDDVHINNEQKGFSRETHTGGYEKEGSEFVPSETTEEWLRPFAWKHPVPKCVFLNFSGVQERMSSINSPREKVIREKYSFIRCGSFPFLSPTSGPFIVASSAENQIKNTSWLFVFSSLCVELYFSTSRCYCPLQ